MGPIDRLAGPNRPWAQLTGDRIRLPQMPQIRAASICSGRIRYTPTDTVVTNRLYVGPDPEGVVGGGGGTHTGRGGAQ